MIALNFDYKKFVRNYFFQVERVKNTDGTQLGMYTVRCGKNTLAVQFLFHNGIRGDVAWKTNKPIVIQQEIGVAEPLLEESFTHKIHGMNKLLRKKVAQERAQRHDAT